MRASRQTPPRGWRNKITQDYDLVQAVGRTMSTLAATAQQRKAACRAAHRNRRAEMSRNVARMVVCMCMPSVSSRARGRVAGKYNVKLYCEDFGEATARSLHYDANGEAALVLPTTGNAELQSAAISFSPGEVLIIDPRVGLFQTGS